MSKRIAATLWKLCGLGGRNSLGWIPASAGMTEEVCSLKGSAFIRVNLWLNMLLWIPVSTGMTGGGCGICLLLFGKVFSVFPVFPVVKQIPLLFDVEAFDIGHLDSSFCNTSLQNPPIFSIFSGMLSKNPFMRLLRLHSRSADVRGK